MKAQPLDIMRVPDALLNVATVEIVTGMSRSSIYRAIQAGEFPEPIRRGPRFTRWRAAAIQEWLIFGTLVDRPDNQPMFA